MKSVNLKESELTNISLTSLTKPAIDNSGDDEIETFFTNSEKEEKEKINNNNRLKSALVDTDRKKVVDNSIKKSNDNIFKIKNTQDLFNKRRESIALKEKELEKIKAELLSMQKTKEDMKGKTNSTILRQDNFSKMFESNMAPLNNTSAPIIKPGVNRALPQNTIQQPKKKALQVNFDKNTQAPFQVLFSERGFLVNGTRLSFELVETALSKNLMITLDNGAGLVLDAIKMQKILKYKDKV